MHHSQRGLRSIVPYLVAAVVFVLVLNAGTLLSTMRHGASLPPMGTSVDDTYYFALIRDAAEGYINMGNVSLKEHASDAAVSGYGPVVQGMLMRVFGLPLAWAVLIGDLLLPFLAVLLLGAVFRPLVHHHWLAAMLGLAVASGGVGATVLRSISPQLSLPFFVAYLAVFLQGHSGHWQYLLRGVIIAALLYVQPVYALYLACVEACDLLIRLYKAHWRWRNEWMPVISLAIPFALGLAGKVLLTLSQTDSLAAADAYRRLGVIPSRLPAAPSLQIALLFTIAVVVFLRRKISHAQKLLVLLVAGLIALNQSAIHGKDIIFGLYYALPLTVVLWVTWARLLVSMAPLRRASIVVTSVICAILLVPLGVTTVRWYPEQERHRQAFVDSGIPQVLEWLQAQPGEQVVLAPYDIADLVPVYTQHYVAFSRYARYQSASDLELAERYLLQEALFPTPAEQEDKTYNLVLGLYAGNVAARARTACVLRGGEHCTTNIRDAVYHQDVLRLLDQKDIDPATLLTRFDVDVVITDKALPSAIASLCTTTTAIAGYSVYDC